MVVTIQLKKYLNILFVPFIYYTHYTVYTAYDIYFSGTCPPSDIGAAGIGQTQGPLCTVQLFGAGSHQVPGCAAGLMQSISGENVLWKSSNGPRHNLATWHQ